MGELKSSSTYSTDSAYYFKERETTLENLLLKDFYEAKSNMIWNTIGKNDPKVLLQINNKNPYPLFIELFSLNFLAMINTIKMSCVLNIRKNYRVKPSPLLCKTP